jgi:subtilase family serine protease
VGIAAFDGYALSDVNSSFSYVGHSYTVPINNVLLGGASAGSDGDDTEQVLDIVQAIGMAPGLSQVRVYIAPISTEPAFGGDGDVLIFNQMAMDSAIVKQLSSSWIWGPDDPLVDDPFFEEFAAQGQSFFQASGDNGAWPNPYNYPQEDGNVTAVGATELTTSGPGRIWLSETSWNEPPDASGGGVSPDGLTIPSYQRAAINASNGGSMALRNGPDVAMEGSEDNFIFVNGEPITNGGGTSFAAPRWAGFMALVNEQAVAYGIVPTGGGLGFINPTIYSIGASSSYTSEFHDITSGNNDSAGQSVYYSAVTGYDLVTGWGSP